MTNNTPKMPNPARRAILGLAFGYKAGTVIEPHSHTAHQIVHAISGTMRVSAHHVMWFLPPGRALWIPANTTHSIHCIGPVDMRTAYLSKAYPQPHADLRMVSVSALMREVLVRLAEGKGGDVTMLLADVLMHEISAGKLEPLNLPIPRDPRIAKLARHLQAAPDDQTTLESWAALLGFSERSLIRNIRAETSMTFRELRRLTRVMMALDKLSAGQSVTATAFDVGFETPSAFIHAFRNLVGQTPGQFISQNRRPIA